MLFPSGRILIFAKPPIPGHVKTRLIPKYGVLGAANLYKILLRNTLAMAHDAQLAPIDLWWTASSGATRHGFLHACQRDYDVSLYRQRGRDLGERMHYSLSNALRDADYAILIGSDCPSIDATVLHDALNALAQGTDVVLGPAQDGGYVLIGMHRPCRFLFQNMRWSQPKVLQTTRQRLRRAGLSYGELAMGWDVDSPADVRRWRHKFIPN